MAAREPRFSKDIYEKSALMYRMLSNPKRLEILNIIANKEISVSEITKILGIRKANTSQHLMVLRYLGLVKVKRVGKKSFYKIVPRNLIEPYRILKSLCGE